MIWGKVFGAFFGYMLARWPGVIIGLFIGHWFDQALGRAMLQTGGANQAQFSNTLFSVLGHLAKSKGRVTEQDIDYVSRLMTHLRLTETARSNAQKAFGKGKQSDFPLTATVQEFRRQFAWRKDVLQFFLEQVLTVALIDGQVDPGEYEVLVKVTEALGFQRAQLDMMLKMAQAGKRFRSGQQGQQQSAQSYSSQIDNAYAVLGVPRTATAPEVKRAYRKLMSKHHPDKLAAQGLPPEMRESARAKAQEIQAAYELIKSQQQS